MDKQYLQIFTTFPDKPGAHRLIQTLLQERLIACAQIIGPVSSSYRWQGKIVNDREYLCILKTSRRLYSRLNNRIKKLHPYEVPEIIALPITTGSADYFRWLTEELKK